MDELHYIEQQLGNAGGNLVGNLFVLSMSSLEWFTAYQFNPLGLNLTGLGTVSKDNLSEVQPVLDELMIKYGAGMYMSPEWRLASTIGMLVYTVHAANTGDPATVQAWEKMRSVAAPVKTDL